METDRLIMIFLMYHDFTRDLEDSRGSIMTVRLSVTGFAVLHHDLQIQGICQMICFLRSFFPARIGIEPTRQFSFFYIIKGRN